MKCAVCGTETGELRIVVRDDYETIRASYPIPMSDEQKERMYGLLDRLVDGYKQIECRKCMKNPSE